MKKILILILSFSIISTFVFSAMPSTYNPEGIYSCNAVCQHEQMSCYDCANPESNTESAWAEARAACQPACDVAMVACIQSCNEYAILQSKLRDEGRELSVDEYSKYEESGKTWEEYDKQINPQKEIKNPEKEIEEKEQEKKEKKEILTPEIILSIETINFDKGLITGNVNYLCSGECEGKVIGINVDDDGIKDISYNVKLNTNKPYLSKSNTQLSFQIIFDPAEMKASKAKTITISSDLAKSKKIEVPNFDFDFDITILGTQPISEGGYTQLRVKVNGIDEKEKYIYTINSAHTKQFSSTFYYKGEDYPISALITNAPSDITVNWKVPLLANPISVTDTYLTEIPQVIGEQGSSFARAIILKLGGKYLQARGMNENTADLIMTTEDTIIAAGQDGWWPAFKEATGDYGLAIDLTEKYYDAYNRATDRLNRWNTETLHIYDVPVTVTVRSPTGDTKTKKENIQVEAAEVRFK